eukprot:2366590-Pyramimonas_sp.AAC.1
MSLAKSVMLSAWSTARWGPLATCSSRSDSFTKAQLLSTICMVEHAQSSAQSTGPPRLALAKV